MMRYKDMVIKLLASFATYEFTQILREENLDVGMLSKLTQSAPRYISQLVKMQEITTPSIDAIHVNVIEDHDDV